MTKDPLVERQIDHWSQLAQLHGPSFRATDYPTDDRVDLVFERLTSIWTDRERASVLDFGCGYGALLDYLISKKFALHDYHGHDVAEAMIALAKARFGAAYDFSSDPAGLPSVDYVFAAGVFNAKLEADPLDWHRHVVESLDRLWPLARRGLAFNMLTSYSDPHKMRPDLYYADPCWFFDHCKQNYSREVALYHDYGVFEFTIHVRR